MTASMWAARHPKSRVSPGTHVVVFSMAGFAQWKRELTVAEGSGVVNVTASLQKTQPLAGLLLQDEFGSFRPRLDRCIVARKLWSVRSQMTCRTGPRCFGERQFAGSHFTFCKGEKLWLTQILHLIAGTLGISRWWRVVGGVSMNLALGSLYAWSVFVAPLEKEFKWKRAETSMVFTIAVVVFALTFIVAGRLQDKLGPFKISLIGAILVSLGFFLCSSADSLTKFFIFFGVLGGLGNGFGYATPIPVMSKWFPDKRGLAVGLAVGGYGGGSAIFGPLAASYLIPHFGWRTTFQVLGVIFFAMTVFGAFLLKNPPAGYKPAGWVPAPASKVAATHL